MKAVKQRGKEFFGELNGRSYLIQDDMAEKFYALWNKNSVETLVEEVSKDVSLCGDDLSVLPAFNKL